MVAIAAGQTWTQINTTISGSPSPSTFNWGIDTFRADTDLVRRAGDVHIGAGTAQMVGEGSATIISGAIDVSTGWASDSGLWKKTGVTQSSSAASATNPNWWLQNSGWGGASGNTNHWQAPEILIIEKTYVPRVKAQDAVFGANVAEPNWGYTYPYGTFYFDEGADTLWIGIDPTGLTVELGTENRMCGPTDNVTFTDMTVEGFATGIQESPIARGTASQTLTRMEFRLNHAYGWGVSNGTVATDVISHHNGQLGYGGSSAHGHVLTRCDDWENNQGMANPIWEAGGSKIAVSNNGNKYDCYSYNNLGYGHWYDIRNLGNTETRCVAAGNAYTGFSVEIGYQHDYLHCVSRGNGWGSSNTSWLWYTQFVVQGARDVTMTECYAEHGITNTWTGATVTTDGIGAINQPRGSDSGGTPYSYDNLTVQRCINDFNNANRGHVGAITDNGIEPTTHNWTDVLWYGPSTLASNTRWATGSGGYENFAGWDSEAYVSNQTVRTGRAPRTMTLSTSAALTQVNIRAGGVVLTCELDIIETGFPDWLTDWFHGNLGDDSAAFREDLMGDLLDGLTGSGGGGSEWNSYVRPLLDYADVTRTDDHSFTLTLPAAGSYTALGETLTWVIPANNMVSRQALTAGNTLSVGTSTGQVSILDGFAAAGATFSPAAGSNRFVIYVPAYEDAGNTISMTSVTLGGQSMIKIRGGDSGTGFANRVEMWYLNEAGIAAMSGSTLTPTWSATPSSSDEDIIGTLQGVDQTTPLGGNRGSSGTSTTSLTVGFAETVEAGDFYIYAVVNGSGATWNAATGYTAFELVGGSQNIAVGYKSIDADGSEQPTVTTATTANRLVGIATEVNPAVVAGVTGSGEITSLLPVVAGVGTTGFTGTGAIGNIIPNVTGVGVVADIVIITGTGAIASLLPVVAGTGAVRGLEYSFGPPDSGDPTYVAGPVVDPYN